MNITINENLKKFRREKGNTQQELADHLGISIQAVSKWECGDGYPDITLIPALALYYNVTSDRLLGMEENVINAKIAEYETKEKEIIFNQSENATDYSLQGIKRVELWRKAQKEFPNNHTVLWNLLIALAYPHWKASDNFEEIIQIGERLLAESTDGYIRSYTINTLCNACAVRKDFENAKKYANMASVYFFSKEVLYGRCLTGEERIEYRQGNIRDFVNTIYHIFIQDLNNSDGFDCNEVIKLCEFSLNLFQLVYTDGDFGDSEYCISAICNILVNFYSELKNTDKALYYLNKMADHELKYYTHGELKHTSFMVNRLTSQGYNMPKNYMQEKVAEDIKIIENTKSLNYIRNDERYIAAIEKMKTLLQ